MRDVLPLTHDRIEQCEEDGLIVHGTQLFVAVDGEPLVDVSRGEARPGIAMSPDTVCPQHCTAAPLTAFACAPLVSRGEIGLDQPVSHFIPEFGAHGKDRVTLRHVLTHTAGLHAGDQAYLLHSEQAIREHVCATRLPPGWAVGAAATYSQFAGWQILGQVVETVVGRPLAEHLREALLLPLGMSDTWVGMSGEDYEAVRDRLGVMYFEEDQGGAERWLGPMWHELGREACMLTLPSGGYSPARDLGRFYNALLDREHLADLGLGEPSVVDQFLTPQRTGMYDTGLGRVCEYGLGFMVNVRGHHFGERCAVRSYGHSGIRGASLAFADEDRKLVVALLSNDILDWQTCFLRRTAIVNAIYRDLGFT